MTGQETYRPTRDLKPWPFELNDVKAKVHLWHGLEDGTVSPLMARYLQKRLPQCEADLIPDAGHMWHIEHMGDVLDVLLDRAPTAGAGKDEELSK